MLIRCACVSIDCGKVLVEKGSSVVEIGVVREIETLVPARMSLLCDRRKRGPYGLLGGEDGAAGVNELISQNKKSKLPSKGRTNSKQGIEFGLRRLVVVAGGTRIKAD